MLRPALSAARTTSAIDVRDLRKTYRTPFRRKKVEALRGVTFTVERGQIFGFVGPNGAGKTTTIRTLMGLIRPDRRHARRSSATRSRAAPRGSSVGFLPEAPYFYDYLTVGELLDLAGRLFGLPRGVRKKRADELIEKVGLGRARAAEPQEVQQGHAAARRPRAGADERPRAGRARRADERPRSDRPQGGPRPHPRAARSAARPCSSRRTSCPTSRRSPIASRSSRAASCRRRARRPSSCSSTVLGVDVTVRLAARRRARRR